MTSPTYNLIDMSVPEIRDLLGLLPTERTDHVRVVTDLEGQSIDVVTPRRTGLVIPETLDELIVAALAIKNENARTGGCNQLQLMRGRRCLHL